MKRLELGMIVFHREKLAEVYAIGEGRTVYLRYVGEEPCPTCHRTSETHGLEHSPLMQDNIKPVETLADRTVGPNQPH